MEQRQSNQSNHNLPAKKLLSVVVPLFNEQDNLQLLLKELDAVAQELSDITFEYILVDDGSADNTFAVAKELADTHAGITVLRFAKNYGMHAAIAAGLSAAKGDCAVFIAGDRQDPPSLIPQMLTQWRSGFKIIFAARTYVQEQPFSERFFSQCFWYLFNLLAAYPLPTRGVDFAMMDRIVVNVLKAQAHLRIPIFSHLVETGFPCAVVPYVKRARPAGTTGWSLDKKFAYAFQTIYNSIKVFRIISALAGLLCLVSLVSFWMSNRELHLGRALGVEVLCLHLAILAMIVLILMLAEHINLRLKGLELMPRFIVSEVVAKDGQT
jgi:dolichol-phosphate mannosyltransferase